MNCAQCQGIEELFSEEYVAGELKRYRRSGLDKTTRMLTEALEEEGVQGMSLLDIGGGLGAIQHEMLRAGVQTAMAVDFVELAEEIPPADIVTLNRVICCYPDMRNLVGLSVARAGKYYGLVFPREDWWMKVGLVLQNLYLRLIRSHFRTFLHPTAGVEELVTGYGFKRSFYKRTLVWQVALYSR